MPSGRHAEHKQIFSFFFERHMYTCLTWGKYETTANMWLGLQAAAEAADILLLLLSVQVLIKREIQKIYTYSYFMISNNGPVCKI